MWGVIKRVLALSGEMKPRIKLSFLWSFIESIFEAAPFAAMIILFDKINRGVPIDSMTVTICALILAVGVAGRVLFKYLVYRYQSAAGYSVIARERLAVGDRLRRVPMGFFNKNSLGEITTTLTTDLNFLEMYAMHILDKVANGFISTFVMSVFLFFFEWRMGIVFIAGLFAAMFAYRMMQKRMIQASSVQKQAQADMVSATLEYVQGISVIKAFKLGGERSKRVEDAFAKHSDAACEIEKSFIPLYSLYSICFKLAAGVIFFLAPALALGGAITPIKLLTAVIATFTIYAPVEIMGSLTLMVRLMEASLDRAEQVKDVPLIDEVSKDVKLERFDIDFEKVSFSYDGAQQVLRDLSFHIPQNTMTAVVGASGCGKTTVTRLIARFWDVKGGSVKVGGVDVREMTCDSLMQNISMVFQNVYLFNDTILNNIKFGNPQATLEQVMEAAKKARCDDFIQALPQGYDTMIGEGGSTLSGGERQRISIARAILKDAPIILLDEATASIDPENENLIQSAIHELVRDKTLVVIAHRLSSVRDADQVLVLEEGKLTQRGTHDELISMPGIYQNFWQIRQQARNWKVS
ncbi:MAG: ABC transporter ATP-binding protein/permease [Clostridiales bacterium]|jgi:ATP-binding cassette subfamily B protein|nr:ABC transporter ATP-binding protein/permease [Clostridiales bacterium]